ncbi:hypothetical protein DNP87_23505, partial [Salmonella enterica subsp. enterica serovar Panama]
AGERIAIPPAGHYQDDSVLTLDFATQNRSGSKLPEGQNQRQSGRWKASLRATPHHCQACFIR